MSSPLPFWCADPSLAIGQTPSASASGEQFVIAPAGAADTEQVLRLFAACGVPGFDVVAVREVCNPRLTDSFHSRLAQLQTRSGNPPFRPSTNLNLTLRIGTQLSKLSARLRAPSPTHPSPTSASCQCLLRCCVYDHGAEKGPTCF